MANRRTTSPLSASWERSSFNYDYAEAEMQYTFEDADEYAYDDGRMQPRRLPTGGVLEDRGRTARSVGGSNAGAGANFLGHGGGNRSNQDNHSHDDEDIHDDEDVLDDNVQDVDEDAWRRPGRQFRSNLMRLDAKNSFQLRPECAIERYYQVADRVMEQFLHHPIDDRDEIIEAYLIGSRLVHFLSSILPTHPEYFAEGRQLSKLRDRAQSQLSELTGYAEVLAIMIDKQEHERRLSSMPPLGDDDDDGFDDGSDRPNARPRGIREPRDRKAFGEDENGSGQGGGNLEGESPDLPRSVLDPIQQPKTHGRGHSKPPLASRHASTSSLSTVPTLEIDVRTRHNGNKVGHRRDEEGQGLPSTVEAPNVPQPPESDDHSASADSYRPLLRDATQPRRRGDLHHRGLRPSDPRRGDHDYDWDAAWVRRHGRSHAVLDQESSVATGHTEDSSHLERSTVDSSLMNPPEARYERLVPPSPDGSKVHGSRGAGTSRPYANGVGRAAYVGASPQEGLCRLSDRPRSSFENEADPWFQGKMTENENHLQSLNWERQETARGARDEFPTRAYTPPGAERMRHALANESGTDAVAANPPLRPFEADGNQGSQGNRSKHPSTDRSSLHRDILEDPRHRWFGDADSASETSNNDNRTGKVCADDPYDEKFIGDFRRDALDYQASPRSDSLQGLQDSNHQKSPSDGDHSQGHDFAKHDASRRYIPGSIRERATIRRQSSDQGHARIGGDATTEWVDFNGFDTTRATIAHRVASPQVAFLSSERSRLKPEMQSNGSENRLDNFANAGSHTSSLASRVQPDPAHIEATERTNRTSRYSWDSEHRSTFDSIRSVGGIPAQTPNEEKKFKVNVTVDGKECTNPSESLHVPTNETIPNHRQSSVRASAERLKVLRSRRLDFRARALEESRVEVLSKQAASIDESTTTEQAAQASVQTDENQSQEPRMDSISESFAEARSDRSAELESKSQLDLNMSIENDSVLNGEVEEILTRESSMMRDMYESLDSYGSMKEDEDVSAAQHSASHFDQEADKCEGDDEASHGVSVFDPFCDDDSSAQRELVENRKRQDVLIEAMRLEQLTFLSSTPPGVYERGKLIPSSRDAFYKSKRRSPAPTTVELTTSEDRRTGPVDLDATVDEEDDGHSNSDAREVSDALGEPSLNPTMEEFVSPTLASPVSSRTRIEEHIDEASRKETSLSSPTSVLQPPDEHPSDDPEKIVPRAAWKRGNRIKSSSESAATSQGTFGEEDDDTAMLNAYLVRKRRPMTHFRGCVKFLLD